MSDFQNGNSCKLTRAVIPMCPECGTETTDMRHMPDARWRCHCPECGGMCDHPDYGYHQVDVSGVVAEMRDIDTLCGCAECLDNLVSDVNDWASRLEDVVKGDE